jgi:radical SAM protein with 4Fe4S-binding SPASM domain
MRTVAILQADLESTPLQTKSRLAEELGGRTILRRTIDRLRRVKQVCAIYVLCPSDQIQRCESLLEETGALIRPYHADPPPWANLVVPARKWSLDGWRGGMGGTCYFDEFIDARLISGLLRSEPADAILCVPSAAPLLVPDLADRMIEFYQESEDDNRLTFCQAPPGVAGIVLAESLVHELADKGIPLGWVFSYKPDAAQKDLIFQPCCYDVPTDLRHAVGRLTADSLRSTERVAALLRTFDDPTPEEIGRWLTRHESDSVETLPKEVEVELTTEDPYPGSTIRPRGGQVPVRGPMEIDVVTKVVQDLIRFDDALIVLGGFGEPLRHPAFLEVLAALRSARLNGSGLYGLAVRTAGVDLSDECIDAIVGHQVDVLNVTLDAWTPELYCQLHAPGASVSADLGAVLRRLDRLAEMRQSHGSAQPIVLPELTKTRSNVHELDDFHDGWLRRVGAVAISGCGDYAGQWEDHSVIQMAPSPRLACRRLRSRCVVLADGRVTTCDQDFKGVQVVGDLRDQSMAEIWTGDAMNIIRKHHRNNESASAVLCGSCKEWHRP